MEVSNEVRKRFTRFQWQSLAGVFIGYLMFYIVRNNFVFSTPYLKSEMGMDTVQIGLLTSVMLIAYGCSKGFMSVLADKSNPKYFMGFGLLMCVVINVIMGFSTSFYLFVGLVFLLGIFQGMGVGPSIITVGHWFPRKNRGRASTMWNVSHNVGGGLVAPIVGAAMAFFGTEYWKVANYLVPAVVAFIGVICVLVLVKRRPVEENLPTVEELFHEESVNTLVQKKEHTKPENMSALQIFFKYVFKNPNCWWLVGVEIFAYMVRFGMLTWIPLYLLTVKGFTKADMGFAFFLFEWSAIPSTIVAGMLVDKYFKGKIMLLPMMCLVVVFACILGYMSSDNSFIIILCASITGCLIYIPQSMVAIQAMEVIPSFALGSAVGLRGFMSYIVGTSLGTTLFGFMAKQFGWDSGFYTLTVGALLCFAFCYLSHRGVRKIEAENARLNGEIVDTDVEDKALANGKA